MNWIGCLVGVGLKELGRNMASKCLSRWRGGRPLLSISKHFQNICICKCVILLVHCIDGPIPAVLTFAKMCCLLPGFVAFGMRRETIIWFIG